MNGSNVKISLTLLAAGLLLATQPGASCVSSGGAGGSAADDRRSPDRRDDGDDDVVPQRADIVSEGRGQLEYTADADGQLYVQDLREEAIVLQRRVTRGQRVRVSPDENRIWIDDDTVSKSDLKRDHAHRLYLLRDRRFERDRDRDDRRPERDAGEPLPSGAQLMGEGRNRELSFSPSRDGRAYIYDAGTSRVVASAAVRKGQRFVFSPGADHATVEGKRVINEDFDPQRTYRVYFAR